MPRLLPETTMPPAPSLTPVNPVLDNFNRANSTTTLGSNWTIITQVGANGGKTGILSNQLYNPWGSFSNYTAYYWNPTIFSANQEVYITIATLNSYNSNDNLTLYVRITNPGASFNGYSLSFYDSNGGLILRKITNGVSKQIGNIASYAPASGHKLRFEIIGTTLNAYVWDGSSWSLKLSVEDTTFQNAGSIGFYIPGNTQDGRFDDFGGGSLPDMPVPPQTIEAPRSLLYKSIDTMKASRDTNTWTKQNKIDHCNTLARYLPGATHITIDSYYQNYTYQSQAYIQEWVDAVRLAGKNVWWRGVPNWAGLTATQAILNIQALIAANPTWFADGDIFEPYPEHNPYIFSNPPDNWNGDGEVWGQWMAEMVAAMDTSFAAIGKTGIITTIQSIPSTSYYTTGTVKSSMMKALNNNICIDFYPMDLPTPQQAADNFIAQINAMKAIYPTANLVISETGYYITTSFGALSGDQPQVDVLRASFEALSKLPYLVGFNYWVGYNTVGGGGNTQLFIPGSKTVVRPAMYMLSDFYAFLPVTWSKIPKPA